MSSVEVCMEKQDGTKSERPWREIADDVSKERDSNKTAELGEELIRALDKETKQSEPTPRCDEEQVRRKSA